MKKAILLTAATLALVACDDPAHLDGASVEQTCPDPEVEADPDDGPDAPHVPGGSEPDPDEDLVVPGPPKEGVRDVEVSIEDGDDGTDILVEFTFGATGTGAVHLLRAPQMTLELVQDGQTIMAVEVDLPYVRNSVENGVTCGSVLEEGYDLVFADTAVLSAAATDGGSLVHAIAMEKAVAAHPELNELLSPSGLMPVGCEEGCDAGGTAVGGGLAGAGAAWCCIGSAGLGCLPCAGGAGAGGAALGWIISAGCKGLFC